MNTDSPNNTALNERRRLAVKLRIEGKKLSEISTLVDLSAPTIIAAHKQFLSGGWAAVDVSPRGRPSGDKAVPADTIEQLRSAAFETSDTTAAWTFAQLSDRAAALGSSASIRSIGKFVEDWGLGAPNLYKQCKTDGTQQDWLNTRYKDIAAKARKNNATIYWSGQGTTQQDKQIQKYVYAHTTRGQYHWLAGDFNNDVERFIAFFTRLASQANVVVIWQGQDPNANTQISEWLKQSPQVSFHQHPDMATKAVAKTEQTIKLPNSTLNNTKSHLSNNSPKLNNTKRTTNTMQLTHLQRLEAESIHIMREVMAEADKPVMLYSIGKDSAVMLHLAQKAFYPAKLPFPLLHVDTGWKFQAMYDFRDQVVKNSGIELITHTNPEGIERGVNPFTHGSSLHTDIMKTQGLRQALDQHGFDVAFGGARRDEETSRAKERVFSFRTEQHRWDPKNQRPELWNLYNTDKKKGESIRVFPLSNWTELDVWQYIHQQNIPLVPLYFAAERPVVLRDGTWIMVDDDRMPMNEGEVPMMKRVRFRTLGCYPLTGAVESSATTVTDVIAEMLSSNDSERQGRVIDHDNSASMEKKKQEGYF